MYIGDHGLTNLVASSRSLELTIVKKASKMAEANSDANNDESFNVLEKHNVLISPHKKYVELIGAFGE